MSVKTAVLWPAAVAIDSRTGSQIINPANILTTNNSTAARVTYSPSASYIYWEFASPGFAGHEEIIEIRVRYRSLGSYNIGAVGSAQSQWWRNGSGGLGDFRHQSGVFFARTVADEFEWRINADGGELVRLSDSSPVYSSGSAWGAANSSPGDPAESILDPREWNAGLIMRLAISVSGSSSAWANLYWIRCEIDYKSGAARVKDGGLWKESQPLVRDGGIWKEAVPFVRDAGIWKETV